MVGFKQKLRAVGLIAVTVAGLVACAPKPQPQAQNEVVVLEPAPTFVIASVPRNVAISNLVDATSKCQGGTAQSTATGLLVMSQGIGAFNGPLGVVAAPGGSRIQPESGIGPSAQMMARLKKWAETGPDC